MGESIIQAAILSGSNDVRLDIFTPEDNFQFGTGTFEDLSIFFERFDIAELIVNQLYVSAYPERIIQFLRSWKALNSFHLKFLLHDFFSVCPGTKLLASDGAFCGVPDDLVRQLSRILDIRQLELHAKAGFNAALACCLAGILRRSLRRGGVFLGLVKGDFSPSLPRPTL